MNLWIVIAAMAAAAAAILLLPFVRKGRGAAARGRYDMAVYRDQLDEVARDESRGTLGAAEAAAARLEIERRVLGVDVAAAPASSGQRSRAARAALIAAAILGPVAAIALYLDNGVPSMPGHPFAERGAAAAKSPGETSADMTRISGMVDKLAKRMEGEPNNLKGWSMLARSYMMLQRYDEAAAAYAHAAALNAKDVDLPASEGEALVYAGGGIVTPKARDSFEAALALDPKEPRARFYLGLASMQAGAPKSALAAWEALAAEGPKDAPWLPELNRQIAKLREALEAAPRDALPEKSRPETSEKEAPETDAPKTDAP